MFCDYVAGWLAGVVSLVAGHPFETIKIQQQIYGINFTQAVKKIYKHRGWKGYYRAIMIPLVANGAINAIYYGIYGDVRDYLIQARMQHTGYWVYGSSFRSNRDENRPIKPRHKEFLTKEEKEAPEIQPDKKPTFNEIYTSGVVAGFAILTFTIPIERIKTKVQSEMKTQRFRGPIHCMLTVLRDRGIPGLYRGAVPMTIRNVICASVRFSMLCGALDVCQRDLFPVDSWQVFTASAISGVCSWLVVLPLDTIKSRLQADDHMKPKYRGMVHCASEILKNDGVIGLYRGLWSASLRVIPVVIVNFVAIEFLTQKFCANVAPPF